MNLGNGYQWLITLPIERQLNSIYSLIEVPSTTHEVILQKKKKKKLP